VNVSGEQSRKYSTSESSFHSLVTKALFSARVSLKQQLSPMDLHRLIIDVRRRVEHEVTFEGAERRAK
jgi:hypothetical protein